MPETHGHGEQMCVCVCVRVSVGCVCSSTAAAGARPPLTPQHAQHASKAAAPCLLTQASTTAAATHQLCESHRLVQHNMWRVVQLGRAKAAAQVFAERQALGVAERHGERRHSSCAPSGNAEQKWRAAGCLCSVCGGGAAETGGRRHRLLKSFTRPSLTKRTGAAGAHTMMMSSRS